MKLNKINILEIPKNYKVAIALIFDLIVINLSSLFFYFFVYESFLQISTYSFAGIILLSSIATISSLFFLNFYKLSVRLYDSRFSFNRVITGALIFATFASVQLLHFSPNVSSLQEFIYAFSISALLIYSLISISRDLVGLYFNISQKNDSAKNIIIYGAGEAGKQLFRTMEADEGINIVGFYDDSETIQNSEIFGKNIYGNFSALLKLREKYNDLEIYLAIPSLSSTKREKIITKMEQNKLIVKTVPGYHQVLSDEKLFLNITDLSIDDIVPRKTVNRSEVDFNGRKVLVTGAGGSIGSEIVKQILVGKPESIILFEISEFNLYKIKSDADSIKKNLNISCEIIPILGDVKDKSRLSIIIDKYKITHVYHAAAYKHVPIIEEENNIIEGIRNNVFGTKTVCEVSSELNVKKLVVVSTDKAVRPTNFMGASKRLAEQVAQSINETSKSLNISIVRFGNVMNSSGSVIPLFRKQIKNGGPVTITDNRVTRFFMTISEASSLVIEAGEFGKGGEVFLLNMGKQVKILDLAKRLIHLSGRNVAYKNNARDGIDIIEIGLRPGEKLYEELLISGKEEPTPNKKIFKSTENFIRESEIRSNLDELNECCIKNDLSSIKKILKRTVEGF